MDAAEAAAQHHAAATRNFKVHPRLGKAVCMVGGRERYRSCRFAVCGHRKGCGDGKKNGREGCSDRKENEEKSRVMSERNEKRCRCAAVTFLCERERLLGDAGEGVK